MIPSALGWHSSTLPSFQCPRGVSSSLMITISPRVMFRCWPVHFWRCCKVCKNSFFQRLQNWFASNWTRRHLFLLYMSACTNDPGGGTTTVDRIVSRWFGVMGDNEAGSFRLSTVNGLLFMMLAVSVNSVRRQSSSSCVLVLYSTDVKILRAVRICISHTPPIWLAFGGLNLNSQLCFRRCFWISTSLISLRAWVSSFEAPTKFVPLSERRRCTFPLMPMKRLKAFIKPSVARVVATSIWTALDAMQVNMTPNVSSSFYPP